jgi:hypothetical protein
MHYDADGCCPNGATPVDSTANTDEALDASETEITVTDSSVFSAGDTIKVLAEGANYDEYMYVVSIDDATTITVTRGYNSWPSAHATNLDIYTQAPSWHAEIAWTQVATIVAAAIKPTPCLGFKQVGGKGTTNIYMKESCYYVFEADSKANLPAESEDVGGTDYDIEVWASYANNDASVGNWAATGGPAGCAQIWRVLCNPEEPDVTTNGFSSVTASGSNEDYLGDVADIGAANGNEMKKIYGIGVTVMHDSTDQIQKVLLQRGSDTIDVQTPILGGVPSGKTAYYYWEKNPDGFDWDLTDLANLKVGFRCEDGNYSEVYGMVVHVIGAHGRRPTNDLSACPSFAYSQGHVI